MLTRIIDGTTEAGKQYPVQPNHIYTGDHFWEAFGHSETEISAHYIVRLGQARGGWLPFTKEEIDAFSGHDFWFNRLHTNEQNSVVKLVDGQYHVTHEFITACFKSSPAPDLIPAQETASHQD